MPYIEKNRRAMFDQHIESIVEHLGAETLGPVPAVWPPIIDENKAKGDLNYVIYSMIKKYIDTHGLRYHRINDFISGVLTSCQLELYDRIARPYEDAAREKNGDV